MTTARYRSSLPQLGGRFFLTDGGIETSLIFNDGLDLPHFAAFHLLKTPEGTEALRRYFRNYTAIAQRHGVGLILESATWRASADWGERLDYSADALAKANRDAVAMLEPLRGELGGHLVVSGCVGPRGDGYVPGQQMSAGDAERYHSAQIGTFAETSADLITAITMNYVEEAIGIANAARRAGLPAVISFTVETDGKLPTGQPLADAIAEVDAATGNSPAYYMINCAHPDHFDEAVAADQCRERIRGLRANASRKSHAELNESPEIDIGDPEELAAQYAAMTKALPRLNIMGGCCGTDERHIAKIAETCAKLFA